MNREQLGDCLELDYDGIVDDQIEPVADIEFMTVVDHGHGDLLEHPMTTGSQLVRETRLISALEQSWPKRRVHFEGARDHRTGNVVDVAQTKSPSAPSAVKS